MESKTRVRNRKQADPAVTNSEAPYYHEPFNRLIRELYERSGLNKREYGQRFGYSEGQTGQVIEGRVPATEKMMRLALGAERPPFAWNDIFSLPSHRGDDEQEIEALKIFRRIKTAKRRELALALLSELGEGPPPKGSRTRQK